MDWGGGSLERKRSIFPEAGI